jgi:uncharacterized membrane protein
MLALIIGIVVFLGVHSLPTLRGWRAKQVARFGLQTYKGLYSLASLLALALLVWGFYRYRTEGLIVVWTPPIWTRPLAIVLMWAALVAFACMNSAPSRIRGWLRHPMLAGIMIWALAHLIANGDAGGMLLFASFFAWAVYDRVAVAKRGDLGGRARLRLHPRRRRGAGDRNGGLRGDDFAAPMAVRGEPDRMDLGAAAGEAAAARGRRCAQALAMVRKPRKPGSAASSTTVTLSTIAQRGPERQAPIIASTAVASPENNASTEPSYRLRTQPETPRIAACRSTQ